MDMRSVVDKENQEPSRMDAVKRRSTVEETRPNASERAPLADITRVSRF